MKHLLLAFALLTVSTPICAQPITADTEKAAVLPLLQDAVSTMESRIAPNHPQHFQCPVYLRPGERASVACSTPEAQKHIALSKLVHHCTIYRDDLERERETQPWKGMAAEDIEYYWDEVHLCLAYANELKASRK